MERARLIRENTTPAGSWRLRFDGASRSNPGPSGCAAAIERIQSEEGETHADMIWFNSDFIGNKTSNLSEYSGLLLGLEAIADRQYKSYNPMAELLIEGDSELVIKQVIGEYQCNHKNLIPLCNKAKQLIQTFRNQGTIVTLAHIPREENHHADMFANIAIDMEMQTGDWTPHTGKEWINENQGEGQEQHSMLMEMRELRKQGLSEPEIMAVQKAKMSAQFGITFA